MTRSLLLTIATDVAMPEVRFVDIERTVMVDITYATQIPRKGEYVIIEEIDENTLLEVLQVFRTITNRGLQHVTVWVKKANIEDAK